MCHVSKSLCQPESTNIFSSPSTGLQHNHIIYKSLLFQYLSLLYHTIPMSRGLSTTNLPPTVHKSETSDTAAQLKGERLSEDTASEQTRSENASEETSDSNILWVNWDGPGDPMNPKRWVVRLLFLQLETT